MIDNVFGIAGAGAFGMFVGFIVRYFLERFDKYGVGELATLLGIPIGGTLLVFLDARDFGAHSKPAYTIGLVLGLVLYQAFYSKFPGLPMRVKRRSPITILTAENRLVLKDRLGHDSQWIRTQKMRFNHQGDRALITQLAGDGDFKVVSLVSNRGVKLDRRERGGVTYIYAEFQNPVAKREIVTVTLTIDWTDAFITADEAIEHKVLMETEKISFTVEFPNDRRSMTREMSRMFGAMADRLDDPTVQGNTVAGHVDSRIGIAETYSLSWNW